MFGAATKDPKVSVVKFFARTVMGEDPAHGWPHVERVLGLASRIVVEEGLFSIDGKVLYLAILLHDVGRFTGKGGSHAVESARIARELASLLWGDEGLVAAIEHAILSHSYSSNIAPESVEAKVLSDADKLDALGAHGIARVFHTGCLMKRGFSESIKHFRDKILKLPSLMHFEWSRREARKRVQRVEEFLSWWLEERLDQP